MKKIISLKEVIMILICVIIVAISASVFAIDPSVVVNGQTQTISPDQYQSVQNSTETGNEIENTVGNNISNNTTNDINGNTNNNSANNTKINNAKVYNTNNSSSLPQTGIEDYNIGILLIIFVISGIYAYNKVRQYKNI